MTKAELSDVYRDYIACLNKQDWPKLELFVHENVSYNGQGSGYQVIAKCWRKTFVKFRTFISPFTC